MTATAPTWSDTRALLRRDRERLALHHRIHAGAEPRALWLSPSYQSVVLYRVSRYHFQRGRKLLARLFWHLNIVVTGADIGPISDCGAGLVILHPVSTQIFGRLGADCTLWGHGGIGGGRSGDDIGAGPGLPVVGNGVVFEPRSLALGPIHIGDNCRIAAGCIIVNDLEPDTVVELPDRLQRTVKAA